MSDPVSELGPAAAYSAQVAQWLNQAYHAQMIQIGFPSFLAYQASLGRLNLGQSQASQPTPVQNGNNNPQGQNINLNLNIPGMGMNLNLPGVGMNLNLGNNGPNVPVLRATLVQASDANVFVIPQVWKRISAEILDFLILFVLKVMITFIAVDFFELVDLDNYEFPLDLLNLDPENVKLDYNLAVQFTQEILILELIHRLVVCVFEALCTHRGPLGLPGGATPGKVIMGLKIVKCNQVTPLGLNRVRVAPAADLGLGWAIIRSVLKNFSLAFFFPVCFSLMFLPYSRTLYDVMSRSIVVENNYRMNRNIRIN
eukprot:TRINITY_DN12772_c0_g1_i1.p1 TRINITY_DN12772_c0_g1~~TRINITY_DN12772_c0_g1_i1.p1  ORF type:complete len:312 (-),score=85.81 TRINITY_DN12772_c0_g1_i1:202-1137(-)